VDGGCDLDARALGCETSLYRALDHGKADIATLLLQYGADVDVECPHGVTILNKVHLPLNEYKFRTKNITRNILAGETEVTTYAMF